MRAVCGAVLRWNAPELAIDRHRLAGEDTVPSGDMSATEDETSGAEVERLVRHPGSGVQLVPVRNGAVMYEVLTVPSTVVQ